MTQKTVAIIQARTASSRLPGKVLMDLGGAPVLGRVVERTRRARSVEEALVATSTEAADDAIADYCRDSDIAVIRGSHFDVLDRYHQAAHESKADIVVRITADCPLIDPMLVDAAIEVLKGTPDGEDLPTAMTRAAFDFAANRLPPPWQRTYPIGLDVEICTSEALDRAWREGREAADREHVMPYLYQDVKLTQQTPRLLVGTSPHGFRIAVMCHDVDLGACRWTVDTAADLEFVRQVYRHFGGGSDFSWLEVLDLLDSHPELAAINAGVMHKTLRDTDERARGADAG